MNYTQAYKSLRNYGATADDARRALNQAEEQEPAITSGITVSYSDITGFVLSVKGEIDATSG